MDEYKKISGEIWAIFKGYVEKPPEGEKEWGECLDRFDAVVKKYPQYYEYAKDYALGCCNELERRWRENQKNGNGT